MQFIKAIFSMFFARVFPQAIPTTLSDTVHGFSFTAIDGEALPLSHYRGKLVLVVNTASKCGFTGQYKTLEVLWQKYRDRGLVIIAVPSNDFGKQEPGNEADIKQFCQTRYHVSFPITTKQKVVGNDAHPFFVWVSKAVGSRAVPQWNFYKYLINAEGQLIAWFPSITSPASDRIMHVIEANLPPHRSN